MNKVLYYIDLIGRWLVWTGAFRVLHVLANQEKLLILDDQLGLFQALRSLWNELDENCNYSFISLGVDIGDFIEPLNIPSHKLVFFAVNDNESTNSVGGSHWYVFIPIVDFLYLQERGI